jgi:hypothetical protein
MSSLLMIVQEFITSLINEVLDLPPTMQVIVVSSLGLLLVWLAVKHLDEKAGGF